MINYQESVNQLRSNCGPEHKNTEVKAAILDKLGVQFKTSEPYSLQQNGKT